jgi:hypothetical protein
MKEGVMSPYKSFTSAAKTYFNSVPFLKFLLSAYIYVFAAGGFLFLLGEFVMFAGLFTSIGRLVMFAGLILTLIQEDDMVLAITSASISVLSLVALIVNTIRLRFWGFGFDFELLLYFLGFGAIALLTFLKSEKFKQMREASAARAQAAAGMPCPRCGALIPQTAGFCPSCGLPRPAQPPVPPQQPAAPVPPVPPQQPAAPVPPVPPQQPAAPVPPVPPQQPAAPVPPVPPQQPAAPMPPVQPQPETEAPQPEASEPSESPKCAACGADILPGAAFCGKCGAKQ